MDISETNTDRSNDSEEIRTSDSRSHGVPVTDCGEVLQPTCAGILERDISEDVIPSDSFNFAQILKKVHYCLAEFPFPYNCFLIVSLTYVNGTVN